MTYKEKPKNNEKQRQQTLLIGIIAAAVVLAAAAILLSTGSAVSGSSVDYGSIPHRRGEDGAFILGSPDAPVKLIAFEDFLCPHCQRYNADTIHEFIKKHVATGQAQFEFRILLTQRNSSVTAQLAECANEIEEGGFWPAHDTLFSMASAAYFDPASDPRRFADLMGISYTELLNCSSSSRRWQHVTDGSYAQQLGVTGTPTVFIQVGDSTPQRISPPPGIDQISAFVTAAQ